MTNEQVSKENEKLKALLRQIANDIEIATDNMKYGCNSNCAGCLFYNDGKDECVYKYMEEIKKIVGEE